MCTAAAEHALSIALNAVGGRVFLRKVRARSHASGTRGGSGPLHGEGSPDGRRRSRTPLGVRGLGGRLGASLPWRHVAPPDPSSARGTVRGRWPGEGKAWPVGPGYSVFPAQLRITTRVLPHCSKSVYPCYRVPTTWKIYALQWGMEQYLHGTIRQLPRLHFCYQWMFK